MQQPRPIRLNPQLACPGRTQPAQVGGFPVAYVASHYYDTATNGTTICRCCGRPPL